MKQKSLQIQCVFAPAGERLPLLVQKSFSLYLRRALAEQHGFMG